MRGPPRRERGIALVLVIWLVTLLLVIAGSFTYAMRTDARASRNASAIARGEAIARGAIARSIMELFRPPGSPEVWRRDGGHRDWALDGVPVSVRLSDESAKIDINTANPELLKGLFRYAGVPEEEAVRLLDAVLDWRDPDSLKRPFGAEESDYSQAGFQGLPANFPFQSTEELQLVLGMRPEVYQRIASMITVYSRQPGVNPHLASRNALLAVPGVTPEQVDLYLGDRERARAEGRAPPVFTAAGAYATYAQATAITARVEVQLERGITVQREAVAVLTPQYPRRPWTLLAWREISREQDAKRGSEIPGAIPEPPRGDRR
jgi:general secretion pathway protein K